MSEFPPLIYVDLVRDEPFTRDEYSLMRAGDDVDDIALAYAKYLEHFQPWPLIHGLAMALEVFADRFDAQRLIDALAEQSPKRVRVQASTMRDSGIPGSLSKLSAVAVVNVYNQTAGKRLAWPSSWKGVLPKPAREPRTVAALSRKAATRADQPQSLTQVYLERSTPIPVPDALPHYAGTDELADAVAQMQGRPVAEIAVALDIPERTVRRIQDDLGIGTA